MTFPPSPLPTPLPPHLAFIMFGRKQERVCMFVNDKEMQIVHLKSALDSTKWGFAGSIRRGCFLDGACQQQPPYMLCMLVSDHKTCVSLIVVQ